MERMGERRSFPKDLTPFEQRAKQLEETPDMPGGDIFVAHPQDMQPHAPPSEDEEKLQPIPIMAELMTALSPYPALVAFLLENMTDDEYEHYIGLLPDETDDHTIA